LGSVRLGVSTRVYVFAAETELWAEASTASTRNAPGSSTWCLKVPLVGVHLAR
jgi:hypothetical protein